MEERVQFKILAETRNKLKILSAMKGVAMIDLFKKMVDEMYAKEVKNGN